MYVLYVMKATTELTDAEMEEHKKCCVDRPTAWELADCSTGPVRTHVCERHGVSESIDLSEAERLDSGAWRL